MRDWHVKHMEKTVVKFVTGLSVNATAWEKRQNKRYGRITSVCRQIGYDMKQGVTNEQVLLLLQLQKYSRFYKKFEVTHLFPVFERMMVP